MKKIPCLRTKPFRALRHERQSRIRSENPTNATPTDERQSGRPTPIAVMGAATTLCELSKNILYMRHIHHRSQRVARACASSIVAHVGDLCSSFKIPPPTSNPFRTASPVLLANHSNSKQFVPKMGLQSQINLVRVCISRWSLWAGPNSAKLSGDPFRTAVPFWGHTT